MQPEPSWRGFFPQQFDDGAQPLMADDDNRSRGRAVIGCQPTKQNEVPVRQCWNHAEPRDANDPEARQGANALNQADQSTG